MRFNPNLTLDSTSYPRSPKFRDLSGSTFGRLSVASFAGMRRGHAYYKCLCACGTNSVVCGISLSAGRTASCGCLHSEQSSKASTTHGQASATTKTAEYRSWVQMKTRCNNPAYIEFEFYGGRGISVCERWASSFETFFSDMGPKPSRSHSLDRYPNNDGNYEAGNCRWATPKQQANNRRKAA